MLNKGYDPDTLRAMSLAAQEGRDNGFAFHVDGVWWLVTGLITGAKPRWFMLLQDVWLNGQWLPAKQVLGFPLISALTELFQEQYFPVTKDEDEDEVSDAQA